MTIYLIKATLCAFSFFLFYIAFLEKENMHQFKRFYLLFSLLLSMSIPLITIDMPNIQPIKEAHIFPIGIFLPETAFTTEPQSHVQAATIENNMTNQSAIFLLVKITYWVITGIFLFRFFRNGARLLRSAKNGTTINDNGRKIILIKNKTSPYSFGNYVFINEEDYLKGSIAKEIVMHELAHVKQKHSLDIVFIELIIAICWFNPILYLYRKKIKENHEFLADNAVLKKTDNIVQYQNILFNRMNEKSNFGLVSSISTYYSTIKKRFIMMRKQTSQQKAWCITMILAPVLVSVMCAFSSQPIVGNEQGSLDFENAIGKSPSNDDNYVIPEKGVSDDLLVEYQNIVDKHLAVKLFEKPEWKSMNISNADRDRLYVIYIQMDKEQRKKQYIHCIGPFNIDMCRKPNKDEWNSANRAEKLFFNGKKAENAELKAYTRQDIYMFINSYIDEKKEVYQSALWTKDGYNTYIEQYKNRIPLEVLMEIKPQIWFKTGDLNTALKEK